MVIPEFLYKDRLSLKTISDVSNEMDRVILHIEMVANSLTPQDMLDESSKKWFIKHTGWIRMLYARLEEIILAEEASKNGQAN
jgi:hypothetical protein